MSNIKNEVITKLRSDIRTKLDQIGAFVDNELADYIMVLVANQKSKYQMKDDLSLFLGATTDEFVNWLHTTLKEIQLNANQSEDKKLVTSDEKDVKEVPKKSSLSSKAKHKKLLRHSAKNEKIGDNSLDIPEVTTNENINLTKDDTNKDTPKDSNGVNTQQKNELNDNQKQIGENDSNENKEQNETDFVLHLKPDGGEVDELLQENEVNDNKTQSKEPDLIEGKATKPTKAVPLKRQVSSTPSSTIGAVVVNKPKQLEEEDDYDVSRPIVGSVASVVRVTQRKSSVPLELQANKNLLLKAVKDANQSINPNRKRASDTVEYTPTPIKKRLGERQEVVPDVKEQELDPKDLRNYLNVSKKDSDKTEDLEQNSNHNRKVKQIIEYKENEEMFEEKAPQFVVTLDGVDQSKYLQNSDFNDRILFDEEMDEEFIESEEMMETENLENNDLSANKVNEKCRFWPSCKNGDECEFLHPTTPCKTFPNCRFGDKCIYIHPNCKYDGMCSRRDCPFTHASKRKIPTSAAIISSLLPPSSVKQCKYVPNCKNPACPYFHPKICRFGGKCRSHSCPFIHPNLGYSAQPSVPHPAQLKWKAKDHISERQFSTSNERDSKTTKL